MEYCIFSPSWPSNQNVNFVTKYSLIQTKEEWVDSDLCADEIPVSESDILCLSSNNSDSGPCELTVTCKPHSNVTILGVSIVSEARTVECYSKVDGYISSMKGDVMESGSDSREGEEDGGGVLYHCHLKLTEQLPQITFKFMGLGDKTVMRIYKLKFVLLQGQEDNNLSRSRSRNIDLGKVKGYLHSMGDSVPDNALDLLQSMEQYQKNQMSSLQDMQDMFGSLNLGQGHTENSGITGLLSMVSKLGPMKKPKPLTPDQNGSSHTNNAHESMLDRLNVRMLPLEKIARSVSESGCQSEGQTEGEGHDVMYKMLQSICGSVSQMRNSEQKQTIEKDLNIEVEEKVVPNYDNSKSRTDAQNKEPVTGMNSEELQMAIQQTVSQIFLSTEERLKNYIDTSLTALENRLSQKFEDMIQQLVHNRLSDPS